MEEIPRTRVPNRQRVRFVFPILSHKKVLNNFLIRNYQPGHNGFFLSPSNDIWNVYHANSVTPGMYKPLDKLIHWRLN